MGGYILELNTVSLQGRCAIEIDPEHIEKDIDYIKRIEEKYLIKWRFSFVTESEYYDHHIFSIEWKVSGYSGHVDGYIDNVLEALMFVMNDKKLNISGTIPFTVYIGVKPSNGVVFVNKKQLAITYFANTLGDEQISDKSDIVKVIKDVKIIK